MERGQGGAIGGEDGLCCAGSKTPAFLAGGDIPFGGDAVLVGEKQRFVLGCKTERGGCRGDQSARFFEAADDRAVAGIPDDDVLVVTRRGEAFAVVRELKRTDAFVDTKAVGLFRFG